MLAYMLKPVKPRGDTSVAFLSTGLYINEPANICHGIHRQAGAYKYARATALESSALFRCVQSAQLVLSLPPVRGCKFNFADCYPVISDRVCQVVLFALL